MKIKSLHLKGIRGVKNTLPLDLDSKSILIFGENGSGKSSISDSIEWLFSDSIEHLSSEEIEKRGKGAIRNKFIDQTDKTFVDIKFSDNKYDTIKSIDEQAKTSNSNNSPDFYEYINDSRSERLILRYSQLVEFIIATKKQKLDKLQEIIGFSEVGYIRDLFKKSGGRIKRSIKSEQFDNQKSAKQSTLIETLGKPTYNSLEFIAACNSLIKPLNLAREIRSLNDVSEIIKEIEENEDNKLADQINLYGKIAETLSLIRENLRVLYPKYQEFYEIFTSLQNEQDKINQLKLLSLLNEGLQVLQKEIVKENACPLCQQSINRINLIKELVVRIDELSSINEEKKKLDEESLELQNAFQKSYNHIRILLSEKLINEDDFVNIKSTLSTYENRFLIIKTELGKDILKSDPLQGLSLIKIPISEFDTLIDFSHKKVIEFTESQKQNIRLHTHTKLVRAKDAFLEYRKIEKKQDILNKQQNTFESLFSDFIHRQEEAINTFLDLFSQDINDFYCIMNPDERVQNIRLVPLKDKNTDELLGITIEYEFYNTTTTQPIAYLSESHINCLGLAFFLASVKAFNKKNSFFILDDVVSSYDRSHRTRFAKLLIDRFSDDFQIILLTHEQEFFELVSSTIRSKGWLINEIGWNRDDGTFLKAHQSDYKSQIESKIKHRDKNDLGNLIRKHLEKELKAIAHSLEAKVNFQYNITNEKRMSSELLDAIQNKLNGHSKIISDKANIPSFKGIPTFIANTTSHDNSFQESIEDLEVFFEETNKLIGIFYCSKCNKYISVSNIDKVNKKISCGCTNLVYEWKI